MTSIASGTTNGVKRSAFAATWRQESLERARFVRITGLRLCECMRHPERLAATPDMCSRWQYDPASGYTMLVTLDGEIWVRYGKFLDEKLRESIAPDGEFPGDFLKHAMKYIQAAEFGMRVMDPDAPVPHS